MKSTRRFAIVALLTIAVSLLIFMTEARHQIEEYQTHHRHRHHRHEIQQKLTNSISKNNYNSEMKSHDINDYENNDKESYNILDENYKIINDDNINNDDDYNNYNDDNDESNKEKYDIFDKNNVNNNYKKYNKHIKHKIINNDNHDDDDDDYDDQDEDDDDYDYDKNNDEYEIDDTEYSNSNQYYPKHKNLNIEKSKYILRDHRSRIDSRLYDAIIKDSIRDYKKLSPSLQLILLSHWHYYYPHLYHHYHHHHHHRHQQITNNYNNELNYLQKQHKKLHKKLPILSELESKINFKYNKNNDNQKIKNKKYNHNEEEINWNENNKDEIENDDENYNDDNDNDYDYDNNKNKNDNNDDDWIKKIEKELKSIKPEINNTTKLSVQSVKRDSRNIENKKFIKNNTHEILYNDSIIINNNNNNNNSDNKIINLNNKNTSIISINKDKRKSRNIINNNQLNQKINIENKKLNSTIQTFLPTTKSLDNKNINNDDNDEKYDTDNDDTDDTDDNNYTQTNMAYTVNDNEYETSVPVTTISPSTTMKIIENLNTTIIKQIKKSTFKKSNITRLQSSVNRASFNKFKTKDGKLSQTQQNGADYNDVILQNMKKLSREAICRWPRPRVIPVRNVYPNPSITYSPHCVILHKCSDDTGCCNNEQLTCAPIRSHPVEFYFYTDRIGQGRSVEKLIFYNDTDCECKNKYTFLIGNEQSHDNNNNQQQITLPPQNITQKKPCKCPSKYSPTIENDDCQCHCPKNNTVCNDLSIGKSYFSQDDKLCIQSEICALPYCAFGGYIKNQDRCPTKKDKFGSIANVSSKNFPKISTNLNSSKLKN